MKNKQLETLLHLKNEIDSVINIQGHSTLKEAIINNTEINTPKIKEILDMIGNVTDGTVNEHINNIKEDLVDVNISREESINSVNALLDNVNSVIEEAKAPYDTLYEAIQNTNTNIQINTTDNSINLTAERQSELTEKTFQINSGEVKSIKKVEPGNKMTHYLVEHNLGDKQFTFSIKNFQSLDKNHNLNDNMYTSTSETRHNDEYIYLKHTIIEEWFENDFHFYETKDYIISTDAVITQSDLIKLMTYQYTDNMHNECNVIYILFKHEYYMDSTISISTNGNLLATDVLYKPYSHHDFESFFDLGKNLVSYNKIDNLRIRMMRIAYRNDMNLKLKFEVLNVPELSYVDTYDKEITLNEIRNIKEIKEDSNGNKFLLNINDNNYTFVNKLYTIDDSEFIVDDYLRQLHLDNNDFLQLEEHFNDFNENIFLNNYIITERQNGNMKYDQTLNEGNTIFHTENNNPYSGDYTSLRNFTIYINAEGTGRHININYFRNQSYNYTFGNKNFAFNVYIQRVNDNNFVFKFDVDEENSTMLVEEIDDLYIRMYFDDDVTWGSDGLNNSYGDLRVGDTTLYLNETKLRNAGINHSDAFMYDALNYLYTYNYEAYYNQYEMIGFDKHLKAIDRNNHDLLERTYQYHYSDTYTRGEYYFNEDFTTHDSDYNFQFPLYFMVKMSQARNESYFADELEDVMIAIHKGEMFNYDIGEELNSNSFTHKHFKNKIRKKRINNNIFKAIRIKEINTTGNFVRFSLSDDDTLKRYDVNSDSFVTINNIFSEGMTKEEMKAIPERRINNLNNLVVSFVELENSVFNSITFENSGDSLKIITEEEDFYDFAMTSNNINENIEKFYNEIEKLDDFNPEKTLHIKTFLNNPYKYRSYSITRPYINTFESSYLETPTMNELEKIRIRDFEQYYEFENLTTEDKVIKLYQNRHYNLNLIDQQSGDDISLILDNANALTDDTLFKDKIINTLTADMRATLLESVMAEVDTVNSSYAKEFTTEYFFDAAASKVYTLPISSQDIMLRLEKFITDNTINFDNRMIDVNIDNYLSNNIQLINSYYVNKIESEEINYLSLENFGEYKVKEITVPENISDIKILIEKEV